MTTALEPELTRLDRRILDALDSWTVERACMTEWRSAWEVAERVREDDVAEVRRVLNGLCHLRYAMSRGWHHEQRWVRIERPPREGE